MFGVNLKLEVDRHFKKILFTTGHPTEKLST